MGRTAAAALLCLLVVVAAAAFAATQAAELDITLEKVASTLEDSYSWSVSTAMLPSGFSLHIQTGSEAVVSTNITRTHTGAKLVVSGAVQLSNPSALPLQLAGVHVLVQQPREPLLLIMRAAADCGVASTIQPVSTILCPVVVQLESSQVASTSALTVTAQAQVVGGGLVSSTPVTTWLSIPQLSADSSTDSTDSTSASTHNALGLGRCAVMTDTFESGGQFLAPSSLVGGVKLPPLGSGIALCDMPQGGQRSYVYRVTFIAPTCGTFKVC